MAPAERRLQERLKRPDDAVQDEQSDVRLDHPARLAVRPPEGRPVLDPQQRADDECADEEDDEENCNEAHCFKCYKLTRDLDRAFYSQ